MDVETILGKIPTQEEKELKKSESYLESCHRIRSALPETVNDYALIHLYRYWTLTENKKDTEEIKRKRINFKEYFAPKVQEWIKNGNLFDFLSRNRSYSDNQYKSITNDPELLSKVFGLLEITNESLKNILTQDEIEKLVKDINKEHQSFKSKGETFIENRDFFKQKKIKSEEECINYFNEIKKGLEKILINTKSLIKQLEVFYESSDIFILRCLGKSEELGKKREKFCNEKNFPSQITTLTQNVMQCVNTLMGPWKIMLKDTVINEIIDKDKKYKKYASYIKDLTFENKLKTLFNLNCNIFLKYCQVLYYKMNTINKLSTSDFKMVHQKCYQYPILETCSLEEIKDLDLEKSPRQINVLELFLTLAAKNNVFLRENLKEMKLIYDEKTKKETKGIEGAIDKIYKEFKELSYDRQDEVNEKTINFLSLAKNIIKASKEVKNKIGEITSKSVEDKSIPMFSIEKKFIRNIFSEVLEQCQCKISSTEEELQQFKKSKMEKVDVVIDPSLQKIIDNIYNKIDKGHKKNFLVGIFKSLGLNKKSKGYGQGNS